MNSLITPALLAMMTVTLHKAPLELPDPLTLESGHKVTTAEQWKQARRPQILELFRREIYGRAPIGRPADLKFEVQSVTPDALDGLAIRKQIKISFSGTGKKSDQQGVIHVVLYTPSKATLKIPAPAFLLINGPREIKGDPATLESPFWPVKDIISRGYATASFATSDLDPDENDGFKNGVHGLFDGETPRLPDAWGSIAAWSWGASRVMDYLQTDSDLDPKRIAVVGHSRYGKAAFWAGAQDERFSLVVSNDSGCTGAALARSPRGEQVANINRVFPHWFNENYKRYNNNVAALPIDQHELAALVAPRLLYIASATKDIYVDAESEFVSGVAANPVYSLFGKTGLQTTSFPSPETSLHEGNIGYHLRTGKHDLTSYDWKNFIDYADRHW